ncbi:MAG: YqcC family protein [Gammaproteobacteria bacterium]|nr:YqcC family protein [Gammaproteobacteria bacterium]
MSQLTIVHTQLRGLLDTLEVELRRSELWEDTPPSAEALASVQPFAVDTLDFSQWLQFIFLARLRMMAELGGELPQSCSVLPMAEEAFKGMARDVRAVLQAVDAVDRLLSGANRLH